jgi:hypothetical protein
MSEVPCSDKNGSVQRHRINRRSVKISGRQREGERKRAVASATDRYRLAEGVQGYLTHKKLQPPPRTTIGPYA